MGILSDAMKNRYLCDILDILCSNTAQKEMKAMITGAMYNSKYNFDVLNITKRMQSGWVLSINDKNIILFKGDKKSKFDTVISMHHVAIFACFFVEDAR